MLSIFKKLLPPSKEDIGKGYSSQSPEDQKRQALYKEKEEATKRGESWFAVIDTQLNPENVRNGFFEMDWNNQFVEELLDAGYTGESSEAVVDQWFKTVVTEILIESGEDPDRGMGHINIIRNSDGTSEVS